MLQAFSPPGITLLDYYLVVSNIQSSETFNYLIDSSVMHHGAFIKPFIPIIIKFF